MNNPTKSCTGAVQLIICTLGGANVKWNLCCFSCIMSVSTNKQSKKSL